MITKFINSPNTFDVLDLWINFKYKKMDNLWYSSQLIVKSCWCHDSCLNNFQQNDDTHFNEKGKVNWHWFMNLLSRVKQLWFCSVQDDYIQDRADTMKNIESTIVELGGIFTQLAHMVKEQEEIVHRSVQHIKCG